MTDQPFEQIAKRYDNDKMQALAQVIIEQVRPVLHQHTSRSFLDYGGGTGLVSLELTDLVESVLLVDASSQMVGVAKEKVHQRNIENARVIQADFMQEKPSEKVDTIFMSLVLIHIPETKTILQTLYDTLNDGGELVIVDFDKNENIDHPKVHNGFKHNELKALLADVGFQSIDIQTFHHGKNLFMNQDASLFMATCRKNNLY
ncbi:class I SAM-dependent methyltransferase [Alkalibacillus almallahensis]|uniref:class I SAM-dependent methyltransferase n=2 Tax=Alkalibacillus TaxID=331654 RepID=UPI00141E1234|nr:class I SAM-dependent methyltransferase [Alkalibacillus almallahensis]NIK12270.1 ubiquinone/menaquinone biosynthesis C-methylase UbiE [Alkalibacillus almallahensis]